MTHAKCPSRKLHVCLTVGLLLVAIGFRRGAASPALTGSLASIDTVFVILMENANWASITPAAAPYIRGTLVPMGAHAEQYFNPPGVHPSEPNYVWLEAGGHLGLTTDADPGASNSASTGDHLVTYLEGAGISWKAYEEDISGSTCPLTSGGGYAAKHNPFVFFQDVTGNNDPNWASCIAHIRPFSELASDLQTHNVARYNFVTPNLCHDMHDCGIAAGDAWLSQNLPAILASPAYQHNGAVFVTWDEGLGSDGPIGLIALSPLAKVNYANTIHYTHSSTLRTMQAIFGVGPMLRDAGSAADLSDLFAALPTFRLTVQKAGSGGGLVTSATGLSCGGVCTQLYNTGTSVTLAAAPDAGSTFGGWSGGGCSGSEACTVSPGEDTSIVATFDAPAGRFALDVSVRGSGEGLVRIDPAGVSCAASCGYLFEANATATLTASSATASFKGWVGPCGGSGPCVVQMAARRSVGAVFSAVFSAPVPAPGISPVRAADLIELRSAIDTLRGQNAGLAPFPYVDPSIAAGVTAVKAVHVAELRRSLDEAYVQAGAPPPVYADVDLTSGAIAIKADHLAQLQTAIRALE